MTECSAGLPLDDPARCPGICCDVIALPLTKQQVMSGDTGRIRVDDHTRRWMLHDLTQISMAQARRRAPWHFPQGKGVLHSQGNEPVYYTCRHHDPETGYCTDHENRPPLCSGYPWYQGVVNERANLPPSCAFRRDVGLAVEPPPVPIAFRQRA